MNLSNNHFFYEVKGKIAKKKIRQINRLKKKPYGYILTMLENSLREVHGIFVSNIGTLFFIPWWSVLKCNTCGTSKVALPSITFAFHIAKDHVGIYHVKEINLLWKDARELANRKDDVFGIGVPTKESQGKKVNMDIQKLLKKIDKITEVY